MVLQMPWKLYGSAQAGLHLALLRSLTSMPWAVCVLLPATKSFKSACSRLSLLHALVLMPRLANAYLQAVQAASLLVEKTLAVALLGSCALRSTSKEYPAHARGAAHFTLVQRSRIHCSAEGVSSRLRPSGGSPPMAAAFGWPLVPP